MRDGTTALKTLCIDSKLWTIDYKQMLARTAQLLRPAASRCWRRPVPAVTTSVRNFAKKKKKSKGNKGADEKKSKGNKETAAAPAATEQVDIFAELRVKRLLLLFISI